MRLNRGLQESSVFLTFILAVGSRASGQAPPAPSWAFSVAAAVYLVPESGDFLQPTVTADRARLHLTARYNYEDLETGSVWAGFNLAGGGQLTWALTPIAGWVIGRTDGVALGSKGSLGWWKLELYSESEYVLPTGDTEESFFYTWSELSVAVAARARVGIVTQRTRIYQSDREVQPGVLAGFTAGQAALTTYVFNPGQDPTGVVAFSVSF